MIHDFSIFEVALTPFPWRLKLDDMLSLRKWIVVQWVVSSTFLLLVYHMSHVYIYIYICISSHNEWSPLNPRNIRKSEAKLFELLLDWNLWRPSLAHYQKTIAEALPLMWAVFWSCFLQRFCVNKLIHSQTLSLNLARRPSQKETHSLTQPVSGTLVSLEGSCITKMIHFQCCIVPVCKCWALSMTWYPSIYKKDIEEPCLFWTSTWEEE